MIFIIWLLGDQGGGAGEGLTPRVRMYDRNWSGISARTSLASRAMLRTWFPLNPRHALKRRDHPDYDTKMFPACASRKAAAHDVFTSSPAACLPMSIIIVGVGPAEFDAMVELDGDE
ncbi:hypothetical protein CRUP_014410, partial [Coryphaenoides rupestris]